MYAVEGQDSGAGRTGRPQGEAEAETEGRGEGPLARSGPLETRG